MDYCLYHIVLVRRDMSTIETDPDELIPDDYDDEDEDEDEDEDVIPA